MDRAEIHALILGALLGLRGRVLQKVRLVARVHDEQLLGTNSTAKAFVFVPDLHLLSKTAEGGFKYGFTKIEPGSFCDRNKVLDEVCKAVLKTNAKLVADGKTLDTYQLGDFLDMWREAPKEDEDIQSVVRRILMDNPAAEKRLTRVGTGSLEARVLVGNHERWGRKGLWDAVAIPQARRGYVLPTGTRKSIVATHGDLFDPIESLPDSIQDWFLDRFGSGVKGNVYELDRSGPSGSDRAIGGPEGGPCRILEGTEDVESLPPWVNVWVTSSTSDAGDLAESHELLAPALEVANRLRAGSAEISKAMQLPNPNPLRDLKAFVIGHSHKARISIHRDTQDPAKSFVLIDCGAWIERCRFQGENTAHPSCQVGVLTGGDMRIYQLDPAAELMGAPV